MVGVIREFWCVRITMILRRLSGISQINYVLIIWVVIGIEGVRYLSDILLMRVSCVFQVKSGTTQCVACFSLSFFLSPSFSLYLSLSLSLSLSICLSVCLSFCLSVCVSLSFFFSFFIFVCVCVKVLLNVAPKKVHMPSHCTQNNDNLGAIEFPLLEHIGEYLSIRVSVGIV